MRASYIGAILVACLASLAVGFGLGFHQAWPLGVQAEFLARGVLATQNLQALRNGKGEVVTTGLERSEEHTSELQSQSNLVCRLLLEKKKQKTTKVDTCKI